MVVTNKFLRWLKSDTKTNDLNVPAFAKLAFYLRRNGLSSYRLEEQLHKANSTSSDIVN